MQTQAQTCIYIIHTLSMQIGTNLIHIHLLGQKISRYHAPGERTNLEAPGTEPLILDSSFDFRDALELYRNREQTLKRETRI